MRAAGGSNGFGKEVGHDIAVTVFRDDWVAPPYPGALLPEEK